MLPNLFREEEVFVLFSLNGSFLSASAKILGLKKKKGSIKNHEILNKREDAKSQNIVFKSIYLSDLASLR